MPSLMQILLHAELAQLHRETMNALLRHATSYPLAEHTTPEALGLCPPWHSQR